MGTKTYNNYEDLLTFTRASKGHALRPVSYGIQLVTNGTFDSDTTNWAITSSAVLAVDSNRLKITSTGAMGARQNVTTQVGKLYRVEWDYTEGTLSSSNVTVRAYPSGEFTGESNDTPATTGYINFVATSSEARIYLRNEGTGTSFFDNVSVKEVLFDESDGTLTLFEHPNAVPRVEYDADGNRLGLLVEEARTNLFARSDAKEWTVSGGGTTTINTDLTLGAFTGAIRASGEQDWHRMYAPYVSVTSGTTYTITAFFKYGTSNNVLLNFRDTGGSQESRIIGSAGNLTNSLANAGTVTVLQEEALPNNVRKVVVRYVPDFSGSFEFGIGPNSTTSGETVIALAAQCEQASFGTSYIKTTGSTATRSADVATMNLTEFGYNHSEGTVVVDASFTIDPNGSDFPRVFEFNTGTSSIDRTLIFASESSNTLQASSFVNSVSQVAMQVKTSLTSSVSGKIAFAFAKDDFAASDDGDAVLTDTSGSFEPSVKRNKLTLGGSGANADNNMNGYIKSFKYYPRRLTNAQLEDLSS